MRFHRALCATLLAAALAAPAQSQDADAARRAFARAAEVFLHPRCTNCHTRGDGPRQGNAPRPHQQNIKRSPDGRGEGTTRCTACHKASNAAIPGAPDWRMPRPGQAGWDELTPAEICAALKDPARNAGLPLDRLVEHLRTDPLVRWAWEPGGIRSKPPIAHDEFVALMRTWHDAGAACPS